MWLYRELFLIAVSHAGQYIQTAGKGKSSPINPWAMSGSSDVVIDSEKIPIKPFNLLGAETDVIWINYSGGLSLRNPLGMSAANGVEDNWIIAPSFSSRDSPSGGKFIWKTVNNQVALKRLDSYINDNDFYDNFISKKAFTVEFKNVANPHDTSAKNNFQVFYVISENKDAAIIYNYWNMTWFPDNADVGVFIGRRESEQCHFGFEFDSVDSLRTDSNCGSPGAWVIPVPRSGIQCNLQFETQCPEPTDGQRSSWAGMIDLNASTDPQKWTFESHHECLARHSISRSQKGTIIQCVYDSDYYDSRWDAEPPTCQDLDAMKTYDVMFMHDPFMLLDGEGPENPDMDAAVIDLNGNKLKSPVSNAILSSVKDVTDNLGLESQLLSDVSSDLDDEQLDGDERLMNSQPVSINFQLGLPASLKNKVSAENLAEEIKKVLEEDAADKSSLDFLSVAVKETTDQCLVECLGCKNKGKCGRIPPPLPYDACCGNCEIVNGKVISTAKPYSTLISACCPKEINNRFVYDPLSYVCCPVDAKTETENVLIPLSIYVKSGSSQKKKCKNALKRNPKFLKREELVNDNRLL